MIKKALIRGKEYLIEDFSDLHLGTITTLLMNVSSMQFDIETQSKVGFILKEIIFPNLPDSIVKIASNGQYIVLLNVEEISDIHTTLSKHYLQKRIAQAEAEGDKKTANKYREQLSNIEQKKVDNVTDIKDLQDQIAQLKAQLAQK